MRGFARILILCAAWSASAAQIATYAASSPSHALIIGDRGEGHYSARLVDLATNDTLFSQDFSTLPAAATADIGETHISVRLTPTSNGLEAVAQVDRGEMTVDEIDARFTLAPFRAHLHAPGAVHLGEGVTPPHVIRRVEPLYSEAARTARISGIVILEVLVDKSGDVKDLLVLKPLPFDLSEAAVAAVRQWKFRPATLRGEPVDVVFNITINFRIDTALR